MNDINRPNEPPSGVGENVESSSRQPQPNQNQLSQAKLFDSQASSQISAAQNPHIKPFDMTTGDINHKVVPINVNPKETSNQNPLITTMTTAISENFHPIQQQSPPIIKPLLFNDINEIVQENTSIPSSPQQLQQQAQTIQSQASPQKATVTQVKLVDELNIFEWFKTDIISQIAEKAKNSVDSVITTLDPGMKEYLYSGGNINIVVIGDSDLVSSIRDAFQSVFGRATVLAARCDPTNEAYNYPVKIALGFDAAKTVALELIKRLRLDTSSVPQNQVVVAIQPVIVDVSNSVRSNTNDIDQTLTDRALSPNWFFTYCMIIDDPVLALTLSTYSQLIPLDKDIVDSARNGVKFPENFKEGHLGFSQSMHEIMSSKTSLSSYNEEEADYTSIWLQEWASLKESQLIHQLSLTLANMYRRKWNISIPP